MEIENVKIGLLKPYEKNAKMHDSEQIHNVAQSIKEFGFQQPIVVDKDYNIIIGHCRHLASLELGLEEVPVVIAKDLTEEQVKKLRLLDNKTNESAWDLELVFDEIKDLDFSEYAIEWGEPIIEENNFDDEEEPVENEIQKHLFKCPSCGYVNEEKAFKTYEDTNEDLSL